ncbi:ras and EF-hand domain-containing protein isoform X1 [Anguilla anguilla]|uniref:ras and EF-hand domain-containing protein isoform X1 n=1 Tax=Anguilla anguilla TaxID=7936 RepID=UPI0015ADD1A7|nr:ras and EF-hand domain-containing protein isoform X1 [Anguilla anguilla]
MDLADAPDQLRLLFHACDVNNSGRIEKEEFFKVCSDLHVRPAEIETIFSQLDLDRDGSINFEEFRIGFQGVSEFVFWGEMESENGDGFAQAWETFQSRLGEQAKFIPRSEQAAILYQNIQLTEPRILPQYERVITNFIREVQIQSTEMESLALAVKRSQDKAAIQLSEMEEEMDQRIRAAEGLTKQEEGKRAEMQMVLCELKRQYESEVCELQLKIQKMQMIEDQYKNINLKEEVAALKRKISELSVENQRLKKDLLESHTNMAFLQSELDALKSDYTGHSINCEREEALRGYIDERDSLERQIEILQSANRKLHDSNDGLRSALESSVSKYNQCLCYNLQRLQTSTGDTLSMASPRLSELHSSCGRTSGSSFQDEDCDSLALCDPMRRRSCEVDSLPESWFDSGTSTMRGSTGYDSEADARQHKPRRPDSLAEYAYESDALDLPDGSDSSSILDWKPLEPISRSSPATLTRKCLSAQVDSEDPGVKLTGSERVHKIVLAGDAAVGKSSLLMRLCKNEFRENGSTTLGVDFQMKTLVVDGEPTVLQLWDTAGQERFRSIAKSYFRRADGVLLLYDITCERSFLNVREWIDMIEDISQDNIPIMLVGNKADLREQALHEGIECITTSLGEKLAMNYNSLFCETSAKEGSNVIEAVLHLARQVTKRIREDEDKDSVTNLSRVHNRKISNVTCCTG